MSSLPTTSTASLARGVWFVFPVGDDLLRVWGSALSGKERVYVNDTLVHERRSVSTRSVHSVAIHGQTYEIIVEVRSLIRGQLACRLQQGDRVLAAYATRMTGILGSSWRHLVVTGAVVGVLAFALQRSVELPRWVAFVVALGVVFPFTRGKDGRLRLTVEKLETV